MPQRTVVPRVRITYPVQTAEGVEERELPFVVGVLADLSGQPATPLPALAERKFLPLSGDVFDSFLAYAKPQQLTAAWHGLYYLVSQTPADSGVKIYVLNATKQELLEDFRGATQPERSVLFREVCTEVHQYLGAAPFSVLVGDYQFGAGAEDMELLEGISQVAAAAHAPFIAAAGPEMFGCEQWSDLAARSDLERAFDDEAHARWRSFRDRPEAGHVALVLPRVLLPAPHGPADCLWGNAAYVFATRLTRAFARHGWCAAIQGVETGGLVEGLATQYPVEVALGEAQEWKLFQLGFTCLVHWKGTDRAVFFAAVTCLKPRQYLDEAATQAAHLAARLPYVLTVSRFAHYVQAMARDTIGGFASRTECQERLNGWISNHVSADEPVDKAAGALRPLREARIDVEEDPDRPGAYRAVVFLRPCYQLGDPGLSIRLVVRLPQRGPQRPA